MRRSAAPSFRADVKRARFLPQIIKNFALNNKENDISDSSFSSSSIAKNADSSVSAPSSVQSENEGGTGKIRSNEDILDLILEADSTSVENENPDKSLSGSENEQSINISKNIKTLSNFKPLKRSNPISSPKSETKYEANESLSNCIFCIKDAEEASLFNVVWCKRSGKKHKTWEGDGFLIVRSRSATLKDVNGKTLDKGLGYKLKEIESLEEGSKFFIGGKECEIQNKVSNEELPSGKYCKCNSAEDIPLEPKPKEPVVTTNKLC